MLLILRSKSIYPLTAHCLHEHDFTLWLSYNFTILLCSSTRLYYSKQLLLMKKNIANNCCSFQKLLEKIFKWTANRLSTERIITKALVSKTSLYFVHHLKLLCHYPYPILLKLPHSNSYLQSDSQISRSSPFCLSRPHQHATNTKTLSSALPYHSRDKLSFACTTVTLVVFFEDPALNNCF